MSGKTSIESLIEKLSDILDEELSAKPVNLSAVEVYSIAIFNLCGAIENPNEKVDAVGFMHE